MLLGSGCWDEVNREGRARPSHGMDSHRCARAGSARARGEARIVEERAHGSVAAGYAQRIALLLDGCILRSEASCRAASRRESVATGCRLVRSEPRRPRTAAVQARATARRSTAARDARTFPRPMATQLRALYRAPFAPGGSAAIDAALAEKLLAVALCARRRLRRPLLRVPRGGRLRLRRGHPQERLARRLDGARRARPEGGRDRLRLRRAARLGRDEARGRDGGADRERRRLDGARSRRAPSSSRAATSSTG